MSDPELAISKDRLDAVIFDLDGVITRTAEFHAAAWKRLFDGFMAGREGASGEDLHPFDAARDYRRYVDGRPRYQGVQHFLSVRGIDIPYGDPEDPPDRESVCGLGNRKNVLFRELLAEEGVALYECAVDLARRLRRAGVKTAVVSASKNCRLILDRAGIARLFDARVDGLDAERLDLDGKPDPDTFLEAARQLGVSPERAAVIEDAVAGVMAGSRGRFALTIGLDRGGQREALAKHGADLVVSDLCGVRIEGEDADAAPGVPPLLVGFDPIARCLADRRPALFLDYDGTLTPIVSRPEDALLGEDMRRALTEAGEAMPVAVVSGRDLADVQRLVGLKDLIYAGSHGFDIEGPGHRLELPEGVDALDDLERAAEALNERLAGIEGAQVERKRFAIAVHFRRVAEGADRERLERAVARVAEGFPRLRRTGGKAIAELRPAIDWDKGRAVDWLLRELGLAGPDILPIYIGDDTTDEDAFRALAGRGLGILVAERPAPSAADWRLADTAGVAAFLRELVRHEKG